MHASCSSRSEQCAATLIVKGTHRRGSIGPWLVGSVAHKVPRLTMRPQLAIRGASPRAPELRRILQPLDGSGPAREALPMSVPALIVPNCVLKG